MAGSRKCRYDVQSLQCPADNRGGIWATFPRKCRDRADDDRTPAANVNPDANADIFTNSNSYRYGHTYTHTNAHADTNANANADTYTNAHTNRKSDTSSAGHQPFDSYASSDR